MFPSDVIAGAQASARTYHVPASVTLAQWALESGFGKYMPSGSNNPFGIKAVNGMQSVTSYTKEYLNGKWVTIPQHFAKFATIGLAFDYHARMLATSPYYVKAMHAMNPQAFAQALQGVYATDPQYASKLLGLMHVYNLYQYDVKV